MTASESGGGGRKEGGRRAAAAFLPPFLRSVSPSPNFPLLQKTKISAARGGGRRGAGNRIAVMRCSERAGKKPLRGRCAAAGAEWIKACVENGVGRVR